MWPETREVASFRLRCLMEGVANARVPQRPSRRPLLLKDEGIRRGTGLGRVRAVALDQVADAEDSFAVLALWMPDVLVPDALLDADRASKQVDVPPDES